MQLVLTLLWLSLAVLRESKQKGQQEMVIKTLQKQLLHIHVFFVSPFEAHLKILT